MSAPLFLTTDELLGILLAEMPDNVFANDFANDPDVTKRSNSSSELRAHAEMFAGLSENLELIYSDKFLSTVTPDGLLNWENDYFTEAQDSSLGFSLRVQNLVSKIRATGGISLPAIKSIISGILGGADFDLLPYSGQAQTGAWVLSGSQLDVGTWLSDIDPIIGARSEGGLAPLDCSLDYVDEGLTAAQLTAIQRVAYTYEVRIYSTVSAATLTLLDARLTALEPAFSTHVIRNGQTRFVLDESAYRAATPEYERLRL